MVFRIFFVLLGLLSFAATTAHAKPKKCSFARPFCHLVEQPKGGESLKWMGTWAKADKKSQGLNPSNLFKSTAGEKVSKRW